jgi:hypothetical protein
MFDFSYTSEAVMLSWLCSAARRVSLLRTASNEEAKQDLNEVSQILATSQHDVDIDIAIVRRTYTDILAQSRRQAVFSTNTMGTDRVNTIGTDATATYLRLSLACRQIRIEAKNAFFRLNTFGIKVQNDGCDFDLGAIPKKEF